jgi:hypothetical protein
VAARAGIGGVAIIGHGVDLMINVSACLTEAASPVGVRCEAGEDLLDAAQRAPVDQSLLLVTHCPAPGQHRVRGLAGGRGERPGGVDQMTARRARYA